MRKSKKPRKYKHPGNPCGQYVYAWLDRGAVFYIGRGTGGRAWAVHNRHLETNGYTNWSPAEHWRHRAGSSFEIVIIRDNLTDEGAKLVEAVLIDLLRPACNMQAGSSERERPPLILPREIMKDL